ncbi:hypothetical protein CH295_03080 [Rhodococcus sp. 14-2483-1-2]|nr:hypothetical protein CH295_03080 [Rhodococcus sp. 14-2483-1-2]
MAVYSSAMTPAGGMATDTVDVHPVRHSAPPVLARMGTEVKPTLTAAELPAIPAVQAEDGAL